MAYHGRRYEFWVNQFEEGRRKERLAGRSDTDPEAMGTVTEEEFLSSRPRPAKLKRVRAKNRKGEVELLTRTSGNLACSSATSAQELRPIIQTSAIIFPRGQHLAFFFLSVHHPGALFIGFFSSLEQQLPRPTTHHMLPYTGILAENELLPPAEEMKLEEDLNGIPMLGAGLAYDSSPKSTKEQTRGAV